MKSHPHPEDRAAPAGAADSAEARARTSVISYWELRSPSYDQSPGHAPHSAAEHRAWLAALRGLLPPAPADVLDVGTGTGFVAIALAELGHRVTGVDLAPGMLAAAREKADRLPPGTPRPDFEIGDATDPPLPPGSVDVVISRHLLWTLAEPARAFASWYRLLRPGGRVVAIDGLWYGGGAAPSSPPVDRPRDPSAPAAADDPWHEAREHHYSPAVRAALPFYAAQTVDPVAAAAVAAGFVNVRVAGLEDVDRAEDEAHPDQPPPPPRYVLSGDRAPGA